MGMGGMIYEPTTILPRPIQTWEVARPKIKILLFYVIYPLAMATYFKKALQHRNDVELLICGPYTGNWIPWLGGMTVPEKYAIEPDIPLPFGPTIGEVNYDLVKALLPDGWIPDIVLNIDAGIHWKSKPSDGYVVTVGTDPHVLNDWYNTPRKYSDVFYNMQLCYSTPSDKYLPYAYSQYDHYPLETVVGDVLTFHKQDDEIRNIDAVLIGMPYEERVQWINELRKSGMSVIFENGPVFDEARIQYNRGRIGLNWSSLDDLNARAFELPAMKLAPVMNLVPDIGRFFQQGTHYAGFTNLQEAVEQVLWLKNNPMKLTEMADAAYKNVLGQTYDARIEQILKDGGF